jgi:uncharacterized protein
VLGEARAPAMMSMVMSSEPFRVEVPGVSVSGLWTEATRPRAVAAIAHGAGAGMNHPFMTGVAEGLESDGVSVLRFNFPYMEARRRAPDPPLVLMDTWKAVLQHTLVRSNGLPVVAGGKSLGGRIASMLAATQGREFPGAALIFFGYPLHAVGRTDHLRDAHLSRISRPMLFIQGTRDRLARLDLIEAVVKRLQPLARLHLVVGGDHSFHVQGVKASDQETGRAMGQVAVEYIRDIVDSALPGKM